jgi:hypothetical protein
VIDVLFNEKEKILRIHEKWIDFEVAFRLSQKQPGEDLSFLCDHVAEDLIQLTLNAIQRPLQLPLTSCMKLRREAHERTQQRPQLIKVSRIKRSNELEVSWTGNGASTQYHVILHRVCTCRSKKDDLLHKFGRFNKAVPISLFAKYNSSVS